MPNGGSVNHTLPSDFTTTSFGEFNRAASKPSTSVVMLPSYSVRVTRRPRCSQVISRPWRSRVLPLAWPLGWRNTPTAPVASSHFMMRSFGTSLHSSVRVSPSQTGPSAQRMPVAMRSTAAELTRYLAKRGSRWTTDGTGYRVAGCHRVGAAGGRAPQYACRTRAFAAYRRPGTIRARFGAGGASTLSFAGAAHPVARPAFGRTAPGAGHTLVQCSIPFRAKHGPCPSHVWAAEHQLHRQSDGAQFSMASFFVEDPKRSDFIGLKVGPKERGSSREESHGSLSSKACVRCASMRARGFCP